MLYESTLIQFTALLNNLIALLDKAEDYAKDKDFDVDVLLHSRLAPDQYDLMHQIQIVCAVTKIGVARLTNKVDFTSVKMTQQIKTAINPTR